MITDAQKTCILSSLDRLTCKPIDLMERFYDTLFEVCPGTETLFQGSLQTQYEKLLEMIMLVTHSLENLGKLVVAVEELGAAHAGFGVHEEHYAYVGDALLDALSRNVADWSAADHDAWATLYGYLADLMITGAREGVPQAG